MDAGLYEIVSATVGSHGYDLIKSEQEITIS